MARSKSSGKWLRDHFNDHYVKKARVDGFRSRAAYKLIEIDDKDNIFFNAETIVDLGSAPGSWSQVARRRSKSAQIYALDRLNMENIPGVNFIRGDFTEKKTYDKLVSALKTSAVDLILSDMAPNMSGNFRVDIPKVMYLIELAVDFAGLCLKRGGCLVAKAFQGEDFDSLLKNLRAEFDKVRVRKPGASKPKSRELYLVCKGYQGRI